MAQTTPSDIDGLTLWLRSDSNVVINGTNKVEQWSDVSGNENHAVQIANNWRPNYIENVINGYPTISFDGSLDVLNVPEINDIRTVFWVIREDQSQGAGRRPLLGHSDEDNFHRGADFYLWNSDFASPFVQEGQTKMNFEIIDGMSTPVPEDFVLISLRTTGNCAMNYISRDRFYADRFYHGEFVEVIIYNEPLSDVQIEIIEEYLAAKYSPPYEPLVDVDIEYGLCDTAIVATPGFNSYLWSTGETSNEININQSGTYSLEVTDFFGRTIRDTLEVNFPGNLTLPDSLIICQGENISFDLELDPVDYSIEWSDDSTEPTIEITESGNYFAIIEDAEGCIYQTPVLNVEVDDFSVSASLGEDLDLCSGNSIAVFSPNFDIESITWSDESTNLELIIDASGIYSVIAQDVNGCIMTDEIEVTVVGSAPEVIVNTETFCLGEVTSFQEAAITENSVVEWNWVIDSLETNQPEQVFVEFSEIGTYYFSLEVTTDVGCVGMTEDSLQIFPVAEIDIENSLPCASSEIDFEAMVEIESDTISSYTWEVGGAEYDTNGTFQYLWSEPGFQEITLTVVTENGCSTEESRLIEVLNSPSATILVEDVCLGDLAQFDLETSDEPIASISWTFGDGNISAVETPLHLYTTNGDFLVVLDVMGENGCVNSSSTNVTVHQLPVASFEVELACEATPLVIVDQSLPTIEIDTWQWSVDNINVASGSDPEVTLPMSGSYNLDLTVTTFAGCSGSFSEIIEVNPTPISSFEFDPQIGLPPLPVNFTCTSESISSYAWDFGDGNLFQDISSAAFNEYVLEGAFTVSLTVTDSAGCFNTSTAEILVMEPIVDLQMLALNTEQTSLGLEVSAIVLNNGNFTLDNMAMSLLLGNDAVMSESWNYTLAPGQSEVFTWATNLNPENTNHQFICGNAMAITSLAEDQVPSNNGTCVGLSEEDVVSPLFPNPASSVINIPFQSSVDQEIIVDVYDASGKLVAETIERNYDQGFHVIQLEINDLLPGIYHLRLTTSVTTFEQKFLKD